MEKTNHLEKLKKEVVQKIELRTDFIINDNRAFIHSKIQRATLGQNFIYPIGGGNFLMTLGVFAVLNLLSKINSVLNGTDLWTKDEKNKLQSALEAFKKANPEYLKVPLCIIENQTKKSEKDCFIEFYSDTKDEISWGIKDKRNAGDFWGDLRNKLSHVATPHKSVAAVNTENLRNIGFDNYVTALRINKRDIWGPNGIDANGNICDALSIELFSENLLNLFAFIKKKIENCTDKDKLDNIQKLID